MRRTIRPWDYGSHDDYVEALGEETERRQAEEERSEERLEVELETRTPGLGPGRSGAAVQRRTLRGGSSLEESNERVRRWESRCNCRC